MTEPVLCYVEGSWAYFTHKSLAEQWGDDWDDAPYEHNAGSPYDDDEANIILVAFRGLQSPEDYCGANSPYSVQMINRGAVAWLTDRWGDSGVNIPAGVTLTEFKALVKEAEGTVYEVVP